MSHPLTPLLDDAWTAYSTAKPRRAPYDLPAWLKAARAHFDEASADHYGQWVDDIIHLFGTGYPCLEGDPPDLRLIKTRPFRPALLQSLYGFPPTDQNGYPLTFYNHALGRRLCQLLAAAGHYKDAHEAHLYMTLSDRHCQRPEWILWALTDLLYVAPTPPPDFDQIASDYFATASLRPTQTPSPTHAPAQLTIF